MLQQSPSQQLFFNQNNGVFPVQNKFPMMVRPAGYINQNFNVNQQNAYQNPMMMPNTNPNMNQMAYSYQYYLNMQNTVMNNNMLRMAHMMKIKESLLFNQQVKVEGTNCAMKMEN